MNALDQWSREIVTALTALSIRAAILLLATWTLTLLMRRASSASRHVVWTLSVFGVLALPMLLGIFPAWHVAVLPANIANPIQFSEPAPFSQRAPANFIAPHEQAPAILAVSPEAETGKEFAASPVATNASAPIARQAPLPAAISHPIALWIFLIWITGAIAMGIIGMLGALAVRRTGRRAAIVVDGPLVAMLEETRQQLGIARPVRLLMTDSSAMPMTWGIFRPRILLPRETTNWPEDRAQSVLLHELAHVRRWDCATQLLASFAVMIHWFNPLIWFADRQMRLERERACDDIVIARGLSAADYAEYLVQLARSFRAGQLQNVAAVAMARRSGLADRVRAILSASINRRQLTPRGKFIAVIGISTMLIPLSAIRLMNRTASPNTAQAAEVAPPSSPAPANIDEHLRPLPARLPSNRVPIQVLSPQGKPMRIDSIHTIMVWLDSKMPWQDGPTPEILARYADGWVLVDKQMFAIAQSEQRVEMNFTSNGNAMAVTGKYPKPAFGKLIFKALYDPAEIGVDTSTGPAAGQDEVAGQVVDPVGKPVAGAVVSFPTNFAKFLPQAMTTGTDGTFRFPNFKDKWYVYVQIQKPGYATRLLTDVPIGHGFLVHLDNQTRLKGKLIGSDGAPAAHAKLEIVTSKPTSRPRMMNPISNLSISIEADDHGQYDVPVEPGQYEIRVTAANGVGYFHLGVPSGQVIPLPDQLEPGAKLNLVAIDTVTNKPAVGVKFYIDVMRPGSITRLQDSERTTGTDGVAQWNMLTPGPVQVGVQSDVYARWWTDEMKQQSWMRGIDDLPIDLSQKMPAITVHVEPGILATGQVLSPDGAPVALAMVNIAGLQTGDMRYARPTDANGNFKLLFPVLNINLNDPDAPIQYTLVASDRQRRWANAVGNSFAPSIGQKLSQTLKMTPGAWLRGRIINSDNQPVAHLEVQAQNGDHLDSMYFNPRTLTDDTGHFQLGPMRGGQYSIYLYAEPGRVSQRNDPGSTLHLTDADRIDVGEIKYDGPTPRATAPWYATQYPQPATQPAAGDWRHVTIAAPLSVAPPTLPTFATPTPSDEEELVGNPSTPGTLAGKVIDEQGHPLTGVAIQIWTWNPDPAKLTDANGQFSLKDLEKDQKVEIRFSKPGYDPKYIPQQPTGQSGLVVTLSNKTYFEGRVMDANSKPVPAAKIRADQGPKQGDGVMITTVWTDTTSDAHGNYRLYVQPDAYDIQIRMPGVGVLRTGKMPIADGQVRHLDLKLAPGITFHAKVVDSLTGQPAKSLRLYSWDHEGIEGHSDASGNITIASMMPGRFQFDIEAPGYARWWSQQALSEWNRLSIEHNKFQRNFDDLDFDIEPQMPAPTIVVEQAVTIRGKVLDPDGHPVVGATVAPANTGTGNSLTGDTRFSVQTKPGGLFEMTLPASGNHDYNLVAHDGDYQQWRKWANGILPPIRTKPGQVLNDITVTLTRPATVRGRVVDSDGGPVANREVRAAAADFMENRYYDPTVHTDKNGNFILKYVRAGGNFIQTAPFWLNPSDATIGSSKMVTLKQGQILENVRLIAHAGN